MVRFFPLAHASESKLTEAVEPKMHKVEIVNTYSVYNKVNYV
jgi:hypothetical protein